jgi:hypothetical protein
MPTDEERHALINQIAESTAAEVADALIEQETALVDLQVEIVRLDKVIDTIHVTIEPVVARPGSSHRSE